MKVFRSYSANTTVVRIKYSERPIQKTTTLNSNTGCGHIFETKFIDQNSSDPAQNIDNKYYRKVENLSENQEKNHFLPIWPPVE